MHQKMNWLVYSSYAHAKKKKKKQQKKTLSVDAAVFFLPPQNYKQPQTHMQNGTPSMLTHVICRC